MIGNKTDSIAYIESKKDDAVFEVVQKQASPEEILDIERRLSDLGRKVEEAIATHNDEVTQIETVVVEGALVEEIIVDEQVSTTTDVTEEETATTTDAVEEEGIIEITEEETLEVVETVSEVPATELLRAAMMDVRKLISFMTNIEVRQNITIE